MAKVHRTELPYDPLPRVVAQDRAMPFDALGAYAWARSLADGAELSVEELVAQKRGMGMPRARRAVQYLRSVGLWHTITVRTGNPECPITSRVVVPPHPWPQRRAVESLLSDPGFIAEFGFLDVEDVTTGPAEARLLRLAVGAKPGPRRPRKRTVRADREVSDGQPADGQGADGQPPDDESSEQKNYPPNPPLRGGDHRCAEGHARPTRGCCTDRARRGAAALARSERERLAARRTLVETRAAMPPASPVTNERGRAAVNAAVAAMAARRDLPR